jgi:hypothetical protein
MIRSCVCLLIVLLSISISTAQRRSRSPKQETTRRSSANIPIEWAGEIITGSPCYTEKYQNALVSEVVRDWRAEAFDLDQDKKQELIIYKRDKCSCLENTDLCSVSIYNFYGQRLMESRNLLGGLFVAPDVSLVPNRTAVSEYFNLELFDKRQPSAKPIAELFYDWHGSYKSKKIPTHSDAFRIVSSAEIRFAFDGREEYDSKDGRFARYSFSVRDLSPSDTGFSSEPLTVSPAVPCGPNSNSSRTEVDIYDQYGTPLNRLCDVINGDLTDQLWFDLERDGIPPSWVFFELTDRQTNTIYRSHLVETVH